MEIEFVNTKTTIIFENIYTKEHFVCDDTSDTKIIDGQLYLNVKRPNTDRTFYMRKESLSRVKTRNK